MGSTGRERTGRRRGGGCPPPADPLLAEEDEQRADAYQMARRIVLRQLTDGARTRAQLQTKLWRCGCPDDVAVAVLDRMTEVGLVDDAAYAHMLVASRQSGKGLARWALAQELRAKGVDDETAKEAVAGVSDEQERDRARELVDKRLPALNGLPTQVQVRRLAGLLARKGYASSLSYAVIREAVAGAAEHARD